MQFRGKEELRYFVVGNPWYRLKTFVRIKRREFAVGSLRLGPLQNESETFWAAGLLGVGAKPCCL